VPVRLEDKLASRTWFNWYLRAVMRYAGFPNATVDRSYANSCRSLVAESIDSQISYHQKTISGRHNIHHHLHQVTETLFWFAAIACTLHLIIALKYDTKTESNVPYQILEILLTFCVLVLPAFGASISAILQQREFKWTVLRSSSLKAQLEDLRARLHAVPAEPSEKLGLIASRFSDHMLAELVDWHSVFLGKELTLP
jgi:hypothetical protein